MLRLFLFGPPRIELNGQAVPLRRTKALALLAYLAATRQPQDRDTLLALLWPEFDEASARNNLRRELSLLKSVLGEEVLIADRLQVAWHDKVAVWIDVAVFQAQLAISKQHAHAASELCAECVAALTMAAQLSTDDFLAGFGLPDSPEFDEWQFFVREELRQQLAAALQSLIGWHRAEGQYDPALAYARRWLALDRLHEVAQRELMRLYAWAGQHSAALHQYEECARLLDAELGAEPEPETTELYRAIKARRLALPPASAPPAPVAAATVTIPASQPPSPTRQHQAPLHNLPPLPAGFVGRQRELADLIRRLIDPDCRLLTLVGPGGIGKTRLALRAAQILAEEWTGADELADGVLFVPLAAVDTSSGLVSALAAAARFDFYPNVPPDQQLLDYFRAKRMLVVLDNFEQLLDAGQFIGELITAAPGLRLLITSRVALNLREEWFHAIEGLAFPAEGDDGTSVAQLARYDAVRLFEQHARRVRSDFSISHARAQVVRLCRLVEGMPLAIELAAAWLKVLSVEQVVAALERDLDILIARDRNIPERHRSMRAVLEESWRLLSADEQQSLARLAVFSGGFSAEAGMAVADAALEVLASLVEQALLRSGADGRFQLHELLRQFAAEQLATDTYRAYETHARHSAYYLSFLAECEERLRGADQRAAAEEITRQVDNVRAAWFWALAHGDVERVDRALASCFSYYVARNSYQEGDELFSLAVTAVSNQPASALSYSRVNARARIRHGAFRYFLGDYAVAVQNLESGLVAARELGLQDDVAYAHMTLGLVARWRGDAATARQRLGEALALGKSVGDTILLAQALQGLAWIANWDDPADCQQLAEESLILSRAAKRDDLTTSALDVLAWSAVCRGEYDIAEAHYREGMALMEHAGNELGVARASGGIGWVAWCIGGSRLQEARGHIEHSLGSERRIGHRLGIANYLGDLALIAIDGGEYEQAWAYAHEGLALARELDSAIYTVYHLSILGRVAAARQEFTASRRYLREALHIASEARQWAQAGLALYHMAVTLMHEAAIANPNDPTSPARQVRALEVMAAIADHPAVWHVCRMRARRLIDELQCHLPPDLAHDAIARGQRLDWQASVPALLDELARPPLAEASGAVN
jgi:predicted ATPase/DNA-binding SARP family transcriptional activator